MASSSTTIGDKEIQKLQNFVYNDDIESVLSLSSKIKCDPKFELIGVLCDEKARKIIDDSNNIIMYCDYKLGHYDEIIQKLTNCDVLDEFQRDILFQTLYITGSFEKARKISCNEFNRIACESAISMWLPSERDMEPNFDLIGVKSSKNPEILYNGSCYLIGLSEFEEALALLKNAYEIIQLNPLDYGDLIEFIELQIAFCVSKTDLTRQNHGFVVISWFDKKKKLRVIDQFSGGTKFSIYPRKIILFNQFLAYYHSKKFEHCQTLFEAYKSSFSHSFDTYFTLIQFYSDLANKANAHPSHLLETHLQNTTEIDLLIYMTLFEVYFEKEKLTQTYRFPILIAFTFNFIKERISFDSAMIFLKNNVEAFAEQNIFHSSLIYLLSIEYTRVKNFSNGQFYIEKLKSLDHPEPRISALIKLYDYIDLSSEKPYLGLCPSDLGICTDMVSELEASLSFYKSSGKKYRESNTETRHENSEFPKNYDPAIPPNPERWLAKHERTGYKPKKKDKAKKGAHQGASSNENFIPITPIPNTQAALQPRPPKLPAGVRSKRGRK
ncbi:hypothetical protein MXB_1407 [Myxobolus squamalis]|nr:hypothetical protein MXB_1407 [Myxobolus squamalis]